jgi:putative spermidine/putrescine transport system ATP-binding protein
MVTHDQTEAMTMSDRVAVFNQGRLEQVAPPLEVYNRPLTRFVGEFIGDSNFLDGRIGSAGADSVLLEGLGEVCAAGSGGRRTPGPVDVLIRPERLRPCENGTAERFAKVVDLTIEATVNYGDSVLLIGKAGTIPLRVRASSAHYGSLREGSTLRVGWSPADMHIIPKAQ